MDVASRTALDVQLVVLPADPEEYRRRVIFQCFKWDPQCDDVSTISDQACLISPTTAAYLSEQAESLSSELLQLERVLSLRPDLFAALGVGSRLRSALAGADGIVDNSVRVMRFDFHPTSGGWALSEVNSDVPGGFAEAGPLPQLAAIYVMGAKPSGDPAATLATAVERRLGKSGRVAFVHATSYSDDRQVMQYLADRFSHQGFDCALVAPDHIRWREGRAFSIAEAQSGKMDAIVRYFPADWLPGLSPPANWRGFFQSRTLMCNPPQALLSQSKRLPLVWDQLGVSVPTWAALLPETRDPREAPWRTDSNWVLKPTFGRVGDGVAWMGAIGDKQWLQMTRDATSSPRQWIAQRRFESRPLSTLSGPRHLCVGVFTIDGRACGFYGRLSTGSIIEKHAQDVPVLVLQPLADTPNAS